MHYNLTNLAILFFCYSFLGWGIETSVASVKHKCYRNRGFLSGPFCLIYGFSGIVLSTFLYELRSAPFFLFLGSAIISTFIEWMTGRLLEQVRHKNGGIILRSVGIWTDTSVCNIQYCGVYLDISRSSGAIL